MKKYTSRLVEGSKESFTIEFRHPVLRDNNGKQGRKIRRGLGNDKGFAESVVKSINEILGDNTLWSLSEKEYVKEKYGEKVADIFFDKMNEETSDESEAIRESIIEMPKDKEYLKCMLVGGTGVGKTTNTKVFLGLDKKEISFPAVSPTRTTTFESEYISSENIYDNSECIVTFLNERQIINLIQESINNAVKKVYIEHSKEVDNSKLRKSICSEFMNHQENRFRLSYILGRYYNDEEKLIKKIKLNKEIKKSNEIYIDLEKNNTDINTILDSIFAIYEKIKHIRLIAEDNEVEYMDEIKNCSENQVIINIILNHILDTINIINSRYPNIGKFKFVRNQPIYWYGSSKSLDDLIEVLEYIGGNNSKFFGRLLTPLINGIRIKSPFNPQWYDGNGTPKLIILEGEGEGHSGKKVTSLPFKVTNKFNFVDAIILVDKASDPMKGISQTILNEAIIRGNDKKIIMVYNKFEDIEGSNLEDDDDKEEFMHQIQSNAIKQMKDDFQLSEASINSLLKQVENNTFFLKNVDKYDNKNEKLMSCFSEIIKTVHEFKKVGDIKVLDIPEYELDKVIIANMKAKTLFHEQWDCYLGNKRSPAYERQHWTRIKALANRFFNWPGYLSYDNLTPASDMASYIMMQLNELLSNPKSWRYNSDITEVEKVSIINYIQQQVSIRVNELIKQRMKVLEYRHWGEAFSYRGEGSTIKRKNDIEKIFDNVLPNVTLSYSTQSEEFISLIKKIINDSIKEVQAICEI